ncbi:hypothetical protein PRIPAC_81267, partial [Pristionchus pacificus]
NFHQSMLRTCTSRMIRHLGRSISTVSRGYADGILQTSITWTDFENKLSGTMSQETTDGILKTSVTWDDFENKLRSALETNARLGPNKTVVDIGDGNGFASCCGLITCDWVGGKEEESLPSSVVLKIPSALPMRRLNDSLPQGQKIFDYDEEGWAKLQTEHEAIHNIEVATYEYFTEFEGLAVPKMYYGIPADVESGGGQMCFEYVSNSKMMQFHERNTVEQVTQIARALGKIQSCSLKKEASNPLFDQDFFKILAETWPLETFRGMFSGILELECSAKTKELMEKIAELVPNFFNVNIASSLHKRMNFKPVLVNGDLHTGNILIDKDTGDLTALLDWQCTHLGVGVEDLHRIAMSALTTEDRRAAMSMLIKEMYTSMVRNLDSVEPPYSLDTLLVLSDLVFPQCTYFFTATCLLIISKVDNDQKLSEGEKANRKEIMLKKVIGILEDTVECENKNKKHISDLNLKIE